MAPVEDDTERRGLAAVWHRHSGVIIGVIGLIAWLAMLWFMFGDVL